MKLEEAECGSCGSFTDLSIAEVGDLYHDPDDDCRSVRVVTEADKAKLIDRTYEISFVVETTSMTDEDESEVVDRVLTSFLDMMAEKAANDDYSGLSVKELL